MTNEELIQQIINSKNVTITPITGRGEVNKVYLINQNGEQRILRLNQENELQRFKKEAWCLEEMAKLDIPSPRLIAMGTTNSTAYMLLDFIPGKNGKDIQEDNKAYLWETIGSYAKKINAITTKGFSETMTAPGTFSDSWERYLSYNIESLNDHDKLLLYGVLSPNESQAIREKFIKLKDKQFQLGLVHGDLSLENIIVENDSVTLIDWGNAESTIIPHMEIIALLQNKMSDTDPLFDAFLRGYKLDRGVYESIKSDIQTLTLLQAIDKLRWAFDKKQEKIEEFSQRVKSLL